MRRFFLPLSDIAILYASLVVALFVRYGTSGARHQLDAHLVPFSGIFIVWILAMYIANLYDRRFLQNRREFFEALAQAAGMATIVSTIFFYTLPSFGITPKTNLLIFAGVFIVLQTASRYLYNRVLAFGTPKQRVLIVGGDDSSFELAEVIATNPQMGFEAVGIIHLGQATLALNGTVIPAVHGMETFEKLVTEGTVDLIVIGPEAYGVPTAIDRLFEALPHGMTFMDLATFTEQLTGKVPVTTINRIWFLENLAEGSKRGYGTTKRAVDVVFSTVAGGIVLVLYPLIAATIKLDSPGPVLFRQRRTGKDGQPFDIIKFRTMRSDAEATTGAVWAQQSDPRITRVGRFLRKTRIDELPQLWNILRGQMSLVGPRAERPEFDERLAQEIPFYRQRYLVKPGLSGWAQIKYRYGASVSDAIEKLRYDLYYIKYRSFLLDLEIILKTIWTSLRQAGQ